MLWAVKHVNELSPVSSCASNSLKKLNKICTSHTSSCLHISANNLVYLCKECCLSVIRKQCIQEWTFFFYSDQALCNFPMLKYAEEKLPTHKHANAKSHPQPGLLGLLGWAPFYRGISGQSRSLLPLPDHHWEPSDINQNLSGLSHPHQLHTDTDMNKRSVVLDSIFNLHISLTTHDSMILKKHPSKYSNIVLL